MQQVTVFDVVSIAVNLTVLIGFIIGLVATRTKRAAKEGARNLRIENMEKALDDQQRRMVEQEKAASEKAGDLKAIRADLENILKMQQQILTEQKSLGDKLYAHVAKEAG